MTIKSSNFVSSRRQFLKKALPTGTLFCLGCGNLLAMPIAGEKKKTLAEKQKLLEDSGMTLEEVLQFAVENFVPYMQNLANDIGREKFIEMLKKASYEHHEQIFGSLTENLPKKDMVAFADFLNNLLSTPPLREIFTYEIVQKTDKVFEMKVTECGWVKVFHEANAADIGYAIHCSPVNAFSQPVNPKIKGSIPKTLMEGDDVCIVRFDWEG